MAQFVLEIGFEEMPARFLAGLAEEAKRLLAQELLEAKLDYAHIEALAAPRRLAILVDGLAASQRTEEEVVTGPPASLALDADGNPTKAALGFARTHGVEASALFAQETPKGKYLAVRKTVGGRPAGEMLAVICPKVLRGFSFPKKMRWGSFEFAFGRPIRWLMALLDGEVVPFSIEAATSGRETHGHRVLGPGPQTVATAVDYLRVVREQGQVVVDPEERAAIIRRQGQALATERGGEVIANERLLAEVVGLVEQPVPCIGQFDPRYLELPREVLLTSLEHHQKSFGVADAQGRLLPCFLTVLNNRPSDVALVRKGWERVLKARLEDARFFWEADMGADFDAWSRELDNVTFIAGLGSMGDKARRLQKLCTWLAERLAPELSLDMAEAGRLAKCDLVSEMVGEFDTLQGIMGGIYARRKDHSDHVWRALAEQYLPAGPDTPVPSSLSGGLLSLADKADTLAGCFGLGMIPAGGDPYALRRAALGIIRILLDLGDRGLGLSLSDLLATAFDGYQGVTWKLSRDEALAALKDFIGQRLKAMVTGQGAETLVAEAALAAGFDDVWAFSRRLAALSDFAVRPGFQAAVLTFKRAANIIRKQGTEAGQELTGHYRPEIFQTDQERDLATAVAAAAPRFAEGLAAHDYPALLGLLDELKPAVDAFFDHVMVMVEEADVRLNRLNLLQALVGMLARVADFNALQV